MFKNSAGSLKGVAAALLLAAVAGGALIAGCDIPTALPIVEQRWALMAAETALGVEELLPDGAISLVDDTASGTGSRLLAPGSAADGAPDLSCEPAGVAGEVVSGEDSITVSAEPLCETWTLEELCPACSAGQPLAAIATERQQTWRLPPEVVSVRISGGTVLLSLDHDLDFAPVRAGELELSAVSIGAGAGQERELLSWKLDRDLDPGTPLTLALDFSRNPVTVNGGLRLRFAIATDPDPAAPPVPDLTRVIRARAHVQSVTIDSAVVRLDEQEVAGEEEFDLGDQNDVDELVDRIRQGTATVTLVNDFPVRVSGTIMLGDTTKPVEVVPRGTTEVAVSYTRAELQELLSGPVSYAWNATVTTDGEQTVDASMQLAVRVSIDITLRTEPEE